MGVVRANGLDLQVSRYAARAGDDPPVVVFVHGLMVDHAGFGFTLGMPFSARADVILYDLRGHGRSQFAPTGYRVQDHVTDLLALLDALAVDRPVHLVGGSYGGAVAVTATMEHPGRVASLTLVEGLLPMPGWGDIVAGWMDRAAAGLHADITPEEARAALGIASSRKAMAIAERSRRLLFDTTLMADVRAEPGYGPDGFAQLRCPVLGVYGDASDIYPLAQQLPGLLPDARLHTVPGDGHIEVFWRSEVLRAVVGDFLGLGGGVPVR